MEFDFNVKGVLPGRISVVESKDSNTFLKIYDLETGFDGNQEASTSWTYSPSCNASWDIRVKKRKEELETVIDALGRASARAQNLHSAITTLKKLLNSSQQKIYIIRDATQSRSVIGMLKVGIKRLFVRDDMGAHHEVDPVCILDFYVHESTQRCGFGHELFNAMLQAEGLKPEKLAVDRPSFKCLAFLEKHYNLRDPVQQNNNFVIYPGFLDNRPAVQNTPPIKLRNSPNDNAQDSMKDFQPTQSLNTKRIKNKSYYASTGNLLHWDGAEEKPDNCRRKIGDPNIFPRRVGLNTHLNKERKDWGVNDAMHSYTKYPVSSEELGGWNRNPNSRDLTPVNVGNGNQRKMNSLQSSWNVLGVTPMKYTSLQNQATNQ
ncbi:hypothetical protein JTE90_021046 [Oedothorax gibbosus]|uniref:Alpha-tubulin N-acetyltransferase n=1 Tax=Oedothorax gibbosus TaxID=931172 RepID=A0AAV6VRZ7_9ARAC|nr:hypothetical protein JTE90_021046 [Oedothorax gibbosus]